MNLFKFKATKQFEHLLDLLIHERLYCPTYDNLNDPFEGQFRSLITKSLGLASAIGSSIGSAIGSSIGGRTYQKIEYRDVGALDVSESRVCSLTSDCSDVRMWSLYGDSHRGVAVEVNLSGLEDQVCKVTYVDVLPKIPPGSSSDSIARLALTQKTRHWQYEAEYRLIGAKEHFEIAGRIKRVILGVRASADLEALLVKLLPDSVAIARARLDPAATRVVVGPDIAKPAF